MKLIQPIWWEQTDYYDRKSIYRYPEKSNWYRSVGEAEKDLAQTLTTARIISYRTKKIKEGEK